METSRFYRLERTDFTILLASLLIRLVFLACYGLERPLVPWGDDTEHHLLALGLIDEAPSPRPWYPPGYPLFLGSVYLVLGSNPWVVRILQALVGAISCWLCYRLSALLFNRRAGIVSAAVLSLYPAHIYMSWRLTSELLYGALLIWQLFLAVSLAREPSRAKAVALGLVSSVLYSWGYHLLLLPPLLVLLSAIRLARSSPRRLDLAFLVMVVFLGSSWFTPFANRMVYQEDWRWTVGSPGRMLWLSNNEDAAGYFAAGDAPLASSEGSQAVDRAFAAIAIRWMAEHPSSALSICGEKLANAFGLFPYSSLLARNPLAAVGYAVSHGLLLTLAILGLVLSSRRRRLVEFYLALVVFTVMVLIFHGSPKYTVIIAPVLAVFAGAVGERWSRRRIVSEQTELTHSRR